MNSRGIEIVHLGSPFSYKFILQTKSQTIRDFKHTQSSQRLDLADLIKFLGAMAIICTRDHFYCPFFVKLCLSVPTKSERVRLGR